MNVSNPLITVIVPIYNVEAYVEKCLSSLARQTYQNIEFILIDDASTDASKEICRRFVEADSRFRLVELEKNVGLSAVRNKGISLSRGEWLGFVDSDDWVEDDMFETLYRAQQESGADIVKCSYFFHRLDGRIRRSPCKKDRTVTRNEALELLFHDREVRNYVWDKLFARHLFDGIVFPEGRNVEDMAVMFRLFAKARSVQLLTAAKCHYIMRGSSITHSHSSVKKEFDFLAALNEQLQFARSEGLWKDADPRIAKLYLRVITCFMKDGRLNEIDIVKKMLMENVNSLKLLFRNPYLAARYFCCLHCWNVYVWLNRYCYHKKDKREEKRKYQ